jgi:serine/threonine protein kinase
MSLPDGELAAGALLKDGRYAVVRTLGRGAQAATLEAVDRREGRPVAIKRFGIRGAEWKDIELAEREAHVLATLSHPALPGYIDYFEEQGCLHLVMERIEGESLAELRRRGPLPSEQVLRLLHDAASALDYLHGRAPPVIHRDIKPGNVIRRPDGSHCLVDFGSVGDTLKPEGGSTVVGTFGYMAPEQFQGRALPTSDVYAAGATALALLTGTEPEKLPHRGLAIDVRAALGARADPRWIRVLERMLEPDPDRRAKSITPLLRELQAAPFSDHDPWQGHGRPPRNRKRERERHRNRHRSRGAHGPPGVDAVLANPALVTLVLIALSIARLAVWTLFEFLLPVWLTLISIVAGRGPRRAAAHLARVGQEGRQGLRRASQRVRERAEEVAARRYAARVSDPRIRIEATTPRARIDDELEEQDIDREIDDEIIEDLEARRRSRRDE